MKALDKFKTFVDGTSLRERFFLLAVLTLVLVLGSYQFMLEPLQQHTRQLNQQNLQVLQQRAAIADEVQSLSQNSLDNPQSPLRLRKQQALDALDAVNLQLAASGKQFLTDRELSTWLAQLLKSDVGNGLRVIGMQSLPAEQVYPQPKDKTASGPALFRKGVELRFLGTYPATQRYFDAMEHTAWPVEWGNLDYRVTHYPQGEIRVVVYTYILGPDVDHPARGQEAGTQSDARLQQLEQINNLIDPAFAHGQMQRQGAVARAQSALGKL